MNSYPFRLPFKISILIFLAALCSSCAFRTTRAHKGIVYLAADPAKHIASQQLDVFAPRRPDAQPNTLIFIHGGNWNAGKRSLYHFLGRRMARKGIVTVIIDYPLSPDATYKEMALACASAVQWTQQNIGTYGGHPDRIFLSGHSAGGHLAALIALDTAFFESVKLINPVKGVILIDAAGLDMYSYLKKENLEAGHTYLQTFSNDPATWKKASPVYHLHKGMPPFLVYMGSKTYPSIKESNATFMSRILPLAPNTGYHLLKGKKHVPMITQFFNTFNPRYAGIKHFMDSIR